MAGSEKISPLRSSLPYQILLYYNSWYLALFFLVEIGVFIWKGTILPYGTGVFASEIILVFVLTLLAIIQIYFGQKGNMTERVISVLLSLLISLPLLLGILYLLLWQTYVLWVEVVVTSIQLFFIGLEIIFSIISVITFARLKQK